jgi:signal transduction histidine kinase
MEYDLEWLYDIYFLELWHVISIILAVYFLTYIFLNAKRTALLNHYLVLQIILLNWLVSKVFKTVAPTVELKWFFIVAQYATVCFLGSAVLMFGYRYATGKTLPPRISIPLNIPPLFFFLVVVTNEKHHLFYKTYDFRGDTFGPLFYAYSAVTYVYIATGLYLLATQFRKSSGAKSIESRLLTAGILIPLFFNALYVGDLMEPRFDITPVTFNLSLLLFAYAIYRHRFLDVVPAGISTAFHNLREGVLVFDAGGRILDKNDALLDILGLDKKVHWATVAQIEAGVSNSCGDGELVLKAIAAHREKKHGESVHEINVEGESDRHLVVRIQPVKPYKGEPWGYMCTVCDNTNYLGLIRELEEKNSQLALAKKELEAYGENLKRLAIIKERNRMAKEIHDILGHTLVLVLNILESSSLLLNSDAAKARSRLDQALTAAKTGLSELQNAFREDDHRDEKSTATLAGELNELAEKYRAAGLKINIEIKGPRKSIPPEHYHAVFRVCQEALTNSLKHGRAEEVSVFVRVNFKELDVYVLDNGAGCPEFVKGHGIAGMEQRIKGLGGSFACGSSEEKGFMVHARLPCQIPGGHQPAPRV